MAVANSGVKICGNEWLDHIPVDVLGVDTQILRESGGKLGLCGENADAVQTLLQDVRIDNGAVADAHLLHKHAGDDSVVVANGKLHLAQGLLAKHAAHLCIGLYYLRIILFDFLREITSHVSTAVDGDAADNSV